MAGILVVLAALGGSACGNSTTTDAGTPTDTATPTDTGPGTNTDSGLDAARADVVTQGDTGNTTDATPAGDAGGPVTGPADTHCVVDGGQTIQVVDPTACHADAGPPPPDDGGADNPYGDTNFGTAAADDDCKYNVTWTSTPIRQGTDVTFTVTSQYRSTMTPVLMAATRAEVFLSDTHPAPNSGQHTTEMSPGVYTIGPVRFDASGQWTVRFHFFEDCTDLPQAPHGHAAFYVNVP